jgi:hypothetical protein
MKRVCREVCEAAPKSDYFIAVASGTPQMHACWVLLAASGEMPARILHVRPARFVSKRSPLVSEVDLSSSEFPTVRSRPSEIEITDPMPDPHLFHRPQLSAAIKFEVQKKANFFLSRMRCS